MIIIFIADLLFSVFVCVCIQGGYKINYVLYDVSLMWP